MPRMGVADLGYEGLNMQVRETSIYKTSGFSSYFFHTLIKQRHDKFILPIAPTPKPLYCTHWGNLLPITNYELPIV